MGENAQNRSKANTESMLTKLLGNGVCLKSKMLYEYHPRLDAGSHLCNSPSASALLCILYSGLDANVELRSRQDIGGMPPRMRNQYWRNQGT